MSVKTQFQYWKESASEPVHFCQKIRLENGVTLLYDDLRGFAESADGQIYHAVCQELQGPDGDDLEILGWSMDVEGEVILE